MEITEITKLLLESREKLHKYACSLTWDWHEADDLMQETAIRVLLNAGKYALRDGSGFYSWARKIMYHTFINGLKRENRYQLVDDLVPDSTELQAFANKFQIACDSDSTVRVNDIYKAVDRLPGETGRVMRLLIDGHKYVEIALITKLPIGTVKTHIRLSREILKKMLGDSLE